MINNLSMLREKLLINQCYDEYNDVLAFLKNPYAELSNLTIKRLEEFSFETFASEIRLWYKRDIEDYRRNVHQGQVIIWEDYINAYRGLEQVLSIIKSTNTTIYKKNYLKATEQVKKIIKIYARAKVEITRLENNLGVDRYLDTIASKDFLLLMNKFDEIHGIVETLLNEYKYLFITQWSTRNTYETIIHKLISKNMDNQVCSLLQSNKKKVVLFIIDGFGLGQYEWGKEVVPSNKNFVYNENIFEWLSNNELSDEYVLGSPLISDTAAGLSQIFIGKTAKDTRIFSSTVKKDRSPYPVAVKSINEYEFDKICNRNYYSFTVDVSSEKAKMNILYCSRFDYNNISGFSKYIFEGAKVTSVTPSERVFSILKNDIESPEEGLTVVYITNIDNSGHTMGSFSQFERYEHEKINMLFKNFIISLAKDFPDLFNGETSFIITADHGMTESYRIQISKYDLLNVLKNINETPRIIEANRAEFLYGISYYNVDACKDALNKYFTDRGINVVILSKDDDLYKEFLPDFDGNFENTNPDIIISLVSEGIFYSRNISENLMHFGGHGGTSVDEVFVPLINIELNQSLLQQVKERFLKLD